LKFTQILKFSKLQLLVIEFRFGTFYCVKSLEVTTINTFGYELKFSTSNKAIRVNTLEALAVLMLDCGGFWRL
jgi:hypothetical protein